MKDVWLAIQPKSFPPQLLTRDEQEIIENLVVKNAELVLWFQLH